MFLLFLICDQNDKYSFPDTLIISIRIFSKRAKAATNKQLERSILPSVSFLRRKESADVITIRR